MMRQVTEAAAGREAPPVLEVLVHSVMVTGDAEAASAAELLAARTY